jgi:NTE family protein
MAGVYMGGSALVLGSGGATGLAWEVGMLAGLVQAGLDLMSADAVVGTSAGALLGAQICTGADLEALYQGQLAGEGPASAPASMSAMVRLSWLLLRNRDPYRYRIAVGRFASTAATQAPGQWRSEIASRLPTPAWPDRTLMITAVDAGSGMRVTFAGDNEVSLVDAVAASTAAPGFRPPVTIARRTFIDGGIASCANVDLAVDYDRIVVIAPVHRGSGPIPSVARQVAELPETCRVGVVVPDRAARRAMGWNPMSPTRRADAARAGRNQAAAAAPAVRRVWMG